MQLISSYIGWVITAMQPYISTGRLPNQLAGQIAIRLIAIRQRIERLVARIEKGNYTPRTRRPGPRPAPQNTPAPRKPRQPGGLPTKRGWFAELMPNEAAQFRGRICGLLQRPEIVALMANDPTAIGRPLRSICWMVGYNPAEIIGPAPRRPTRPKPPRPQPAPAPQKPGISWAKPRGSISNRLYRHRNRGSPKKA